MSWRASAWAKEQRLGSPAAKSILMCLADYADAKTNECWPSQPDLAEDAEVSERTAREWLQRLEEWGLISRERRTRASGARANDLIVLNLDARVVDGAERCRAIKDGGQVDAADTGSLPADIAGRAYRQLDAEPTGNEEQPTGNQIRAYKEEPSIEPPNEPLTEGAREGAPERGADRKKRETRAWALLARWPGFAGMPKDRALKAALALDDEAFDRAERRFDGWLALLKSQRKDHTPAPSTYFGERLFDEVPDPSQPVVPAYVDAPPFGKAWMAHRLASLLAGPTFTAFRLTGFEESLVSQGKADRAELMRGKQAATGFPSVNRMHDDAERRRGASVPARTAALGDGFVQVRRGTEAFEDWREEHRLRGWPWLPEVVEWVWFPPGASAPAARAAFEVLMAEQQGGREAAE